jgi:hypothetical protein
MEVKHKISFQVGREFEQHTAEFTLSAEDIKFDEFEGLNLVQRMFVLNALVLIEGLLFQEAEGYIDEEEFKKRRSRVVGFMSEKVKSVFASIIKKD